MNSIRGGGKEKDRNNLWNVEYTLHLHKKIVIPPTAKSKMPMITKKRDQAFSKLSESRRRPGTDVKQIFAKLLTDSP